MLQNIPCICCVPLPVDITYAPLQWGAEALTVLYPKNKEPYVCITELNRKVGFLCTPDSAVL